MPNPDSQTLAEPDLLRFAGEFGKARSAGDLILLSGPLGAGKTTFVRGLLHALGWNEPVRSPTFNLINLYPTVPPVLHADLYRLTSADMNSLGMDDYLSDHLALIEWPERLGNSVSDLAAFHVTIEFVREPDLRRITIRTPNG